VVWGNARYTDDSQAATMGWQAKRRFAAALKKCMIFRAMIRLNSRTHDRKTDARTKPVIFKAKF
jgi:hypothetical protein